MYKRQIISSAGDGSYFSRGPAVRAAVPPSAGGVRSMTSLKFCATIASRSFSASEWWVSSAAAAGASAAPVSVSAVQSTVIRLSFIHSPS